MLLGVVESAMVESCFVEKDLQKELFMVKEVFDIVWFILNYEPFHHFSRESSRFQRATRYWGRLHAVGLHRRSDGRVSGLSYLHGKVDQRQQYRDGADELTDATQFLDGHGALLC